MNKLSSQTEREKQMVKTDKSIESSFQKCVHNEMHVNTSEPAASSVSISYIGGTPTLSQKRVAEALSPIVNRQESQCCVVREC